MKQESNNIRPKKFLGQHFLKNDDVSLRIASSVPTHNNSTLLEIGPGTGALTQFLMERPYSKFIAMEVDRESVPYLLNKYCKTDLNIIEADFLKYDWSRMSRLAVCGNFPYNISSQIYFKVLDHIDHVESVTGMLQYEVAARICSGPGSKNYGILSVLLQHYFNAELLFEVGSENFDPPPKVNSAVIRLVKRDKVEELPIPEKKFRTLVKSAFGNRRKTLWNALKSFPMQESFRENTLSQKRAEQLTVQDFIELSKQTAFYGA